MWLVFGFMAIVCTLLNIWCTIRHKDNVWWGFLALSFTALTLCADQSMIAQFVRSKDLDALEDIVPTMSIAYWILTIGSIALNGISLWTGRKKTSLR